MQNNTQYLLLQSVLKDQKKLREKEAKRKGKNRNIKTKLLTDSKKTSKFSEKYSDRVKSIKNTEAKILENKKIASEIEKMERSKINSMHAQRTNNENVGRLSYQKDPYRRGHGKRNK